MHINSLIAGIESVLPVPSLHCNPLDSAMVLEICSDYSRYDRHYCNSLRLGDEEGLDQTRIWGYLQLIQFICSKPES